ncbi:ABC transporter permease [Nocardioides sp. YIM B13467]|uniref:ABC transporter permease n=1 Tax=Nocardioides sp. YIM B13467 TaxID=3366294 RepID=UPI0036706BEB
MTQTAPPPTASRTAADLPGDLQRRLPRWGDIPTAVRRGLLLLTLLLAWDLGVRFGGVSPLVLVGPLDVAQAMGEGVRSGALVDSTLLTLRILGQALVIGIVAAAVLTTLATWTTIGEDLLVLLTSMLNPLPAVAILPLAMLWFGINTTALIVVIANAVIWPIAINVSQGFRTANPTVVAVGRNIGLRGARLVWYVLVPAALPHTVSGLKSAWAFGWRTIIAAELVFGVAGEGGGLGYFINNAKTYLHIADAFAGLVTIALIGILFDLVFSWLERRTVVRWGMKTA